MWFTGLFTDHLPFWYVVLSSPLLFFHTRSKPTATSTKWKLPLPLTALPVVPPPETLDVIIPSLTVNSSCLKFSIAQTPCTFVRALSFLFSVSFFGGFRVRVRLLSLFFRFLMFSIFYVVFFVPRCRPLLPSLHQDASPCWNGHSPGHVQPSPAWILEYGVQLLGCQNRRCLSCPLDGCKIENEKKQACSLCVSRYGKSEACVSTSFCVCIKI